METLKFGTRGSALARRQTQLVIDDLTSRFPYIRCEVVVLQTPGDRWQDRPIWSLGDKGVFVRPLEQALLDGRVDLAVHSLKDVPADDDAAGIGLVAFPQREDARDVLISRNGGTLDALPQEARVATGSLRRRMQLRSIRPDLVLVDVRGNVDTRLRKLDEGQYDALVLAAAGLKRLGLEERVSEYFTVDRLVPDAGQGILAIQGRAGDPASDIVSVLDDESTRTCATAERSTVRALGADCRSPVGVHAQVMGDRLFICAIAAADSESLAISDRIEGKRVLAAGLGRELGERLKEEILRELGTTSTS